MNFLFCIFSRQSNEIGRNRVEDADDSERHHATAVAKTPISSLPTIVWEQPNGLCVTRAGAGTAKPSDWKNDKA